MYKKEGKQKIEIPTADFGLIGGSSTLSLEMPEDLELADVHVVGRGMVFPTPYGDSPEFKHLLIMGQDGVERSVLACKMHGWRSGVNRGDASRQVFYIFKQAGVKRILAEGGVGAVNHLLKPRDIIIPDDYMDFSMRKDVGITDRYLLVMRDSLCMEMRRELLSVLEAKWKSGRIFDRGVYVNTDGRHFESPAEVNHYKLAGGDIVGQSICPEVYLAREIGACYAGVYMVVNYAEGIVSPWQHEELSDIFYNESRAVGEVVVDLLRRIPLEPSCGCKSLRKDTLLKKVYE